MQIEVLSKNTDKKTDLVTLLAREKDLTATGDTMQVPGLILQMGAEYLLLSTGSVSWIQRILPLLFSVKPIGGAGQLYEPVTDMRIVVTARCYDPVQLLPHLHEVSHLDLDRGELLGVRFAEWRSRDITIVSRAELAVQGHVLTARIKFSTHARDSQYNCQLCIQQVSLVDLLGPLCPDFTEPALVRQISDLVLRAEQKLTARQWATMLNRHGLPVRYCRQNDSYRADLPGGGVITFHRSSSQGEIICQMELPGPGSLATRPLGDLINDLNFQQITLSQTAENMVLPPDSLVDQLGFEKREEYHLYARETPHFIATYNVRDLHLELRGVIDLAGAMVAPDHIHGIYREMKQFMEQVVTHAGTGA